MALVNHDHVSLLGDSGVRNQPLACAFHSARDLCQVDHVGSNHVGPRNGWVHPKFEILHFHLMTVATNETQVGSRATMGYPLVGCKPCWTPNHATSPGAPASITPGLSCPREGGDQASRNTGLVASPCHLKNVQSTDHLFKDDLETAMENQHISTTALPIFLPFSCQQPLYSAKCGQFNSLFKGSSSKST